MAELERLCLPNMRLSDLHHSLLLPRLHTLECGNADGDEKEDEDDALAVCSSIFSRPLPHLRHLYLDNIPLLGLDGRWRSHLLPVVPALIAAHSAHLLTLRLRHEYYRGRDDAVYALQSDKRSR